jgi:hypothetical protein
MRRKKVWMKLRHQNPRTSTHKNATPYNATLENVIGRCNNRSTLFSDRRYEGGEKGRRLAVGCSLPRNTTRRMLELVKVVFYPMLSEFRQSTAFGTFPCSLTVRATYRRKWVGSKCEAILTWKKEELRGTIPVPLVSNTNLTQTGLGSNTTLQVESQATNLMIMPWPSEPVLCTTVFFGQVLRLLPQSLLSTKQRMDYLGITALCEVTGRWVGLSAAQCCTATRTKA